MAEQLRRIVPVHDERPQPVGADETLAVVGDPVPALGEQRQRARGEVGAQQRRKVHPRRVGIGGLDLAPHPTPGRSHRPTSAGDRGRRSPAGTRWSDRRAGSGRVQPKRSSSASNSSWSRSAANATMRPGPPAACRATPENEAQPPGLFGAPLMTSIAKLPSTVTPGTSLTHCGRTDRSPWSTSAGPRRQWGEMVVVIAGIRRFCGSHGQVVGRDHLDRRRARLLRGQGAVLLQNQAHREPGVRAKVVVQHH